jgi:hypothetical protein
MTTTTVPTAAPGKTDAKPSPKKKRRAAPAKSAIAKNTIAKRPTTLEDARREMLRLVYLHSAAMTQAVIDDALQGKYLSARFLLEAAGLCTVKGEELEDIEERESLASLLLKRWQLATRSGEVTEVPEVTTDLASATEAPVKS